MTPCHYVLDSVRATAIFGVPKKENTVPKKFREKRETRLLEKL